MIGDYEDPDRLAWRRKGVEKTLEDSSLSTRLEKINEIVNRPSPDRVMVPVVSVSERDWETLKMLSKL